MAVEKEEKRNGFRPEQGLGHKFRQISIGMDKYFARRDAGDVEKECRIMPRGQGPLMGYLLDHENENVCQKDLEKHFHISGATASNMLKTMEKNGLLQRLPMEEDARLKRIVPTEYGRELEAESRNYIRLLEEAMQAGFTEQEMQQFREYLDRLVANLRKVNEI